MKLLRCFFANVLHENFDDRQLSLSKLTKYFNFHFLFNFKRLMKTFLFSTCQCSKRIRRAMTMRSSNLHFTYLLIYLLTYLFGYNFNRQ